ncbi:MAG: efflux RND transporter periplasmic adaptor subunit [Thermodesulfobacteriota bacterium]
MRRRYWQISLIILLAMVGVGLYLRFSKTTDTGSEPGSLGRTAPAPPVAMIERLPVKTTPALKRDLEMTMPVFGAINYLTKVDVVSEIPGVLKEVPVKTGDLVRIGEIVAVMDTELLQAELKTKAALKAQAEAQLHLAAWQYQAQRKVHKVGGISLNDLQEAEAKYHEKQAEVARYAAEMAQTRTQIKKATITSPIVGIVGHQNFYAGERVPRESEKGVLTLMQVDEVYGEAEVNERDMARLRPGLEAIVIPDAFPHSPVRGKIDRLEPVLKPESRSVIAKVRLANPQLLLKPGMFSRIEIILDKIPEVVAIPSAALRQAPDKSWQVFVVSDDVAFLRKVTVGTVTPTWAEIKEGLQPGEMVVVEGGERLKDLSRVISTPAGPPGP